MGRQYVCVGSQDKLQPHVSVSLSVDVGLEGNKYNGKITKVITAALSFWSHQVLAEAVATVTNNFFLVSHYNIKRLF